MIGDSQSQTPKYREDYLFRQSADAVMRNDYYNVFRETDIGRASASVVCPDSKLQILNETEYSLRILYNSTYRLLHVMVLHWRKAILYIGRKSIKILGNTIDYQIDKTSVQPGVYQEEIKKINFNINDTGSVTFAMYDGLFSVRKYSIVYHT